MKKSIYFLGLSFLIFSCSGESKENNTEETVVVEDTAKVEEDIYTPEDPVTSEYYLEEFPDVWWLLSTDEDGMYYIEDHWESQNRTIEFTMPEDVEYGYLYVNYAQDSDEGAISNWKAEITEGEGIRIVKGSFDWYSKLYEEDRHVEFEWNQLQYQAEFKGIFGEGSVENFIDGRNKDMYETIVIEREED